MTRSIHKILLDSLLLLKFAVLRRKKLKGLAIREVRAGSGCNSCGPSSGVGVSDGGSGAGRAVGVVGAGSRGDIGGPLGGGQVGCNVGHSIAVGVVGAAGRVNTGGQKNLAGGQAEEGGKNSLKLMK